MKKFLWILMSLFFIGGGVFCIVAMMFFLLPGSKAKANLDLPTSIVDTVDASASTESQMQEGYDNIYIADVHQTLTLRAQPSSDAASLIENGGGLAPMTHMQVLEVITESNFAYVEVINGAYEGMTGYVNMDYITRLGEPTIRINN